MQVDLKGRVAIITGAATGLGRVLAEGLVRSGASVMLTDKDGPGAEKAAAELKGVGGEVIGRELDVVSDAGIDAIVAETVKHFGGIDILVNNAGLARGRWQDVSDLETAEWLLLFHVNVAAPARFAKAVRPHMKARGGGVIVNQSSNAAYFQPAMGHSYSISKLAISGLTVALAEEFAPDNIRVNGIAPGMMTGRVPPEIAEMVVGQQALKRRGKPEDLVGGLLYLCSDASSFVTGQTLIIDGGAARRV